MELILLHAKPIIIILFVVSILLIILTKLISVKNPNNSNKINIILPYKSKYLLTNTEYTFYKILKPIMDKHDCLICPKVGLKDIVNITDKENYMKWFSKISQKHIDFLICNKDLKPLFALELDDNSHEKEKAKNNDDFKNNLFTKIGLPLKRIKTNNYNDLENILFQPINTEINKG